ncbi:uncharacterized protein [Euwallacea similis]|uniref:uncharacterized protein n=1 Tax=Euwallacea similis TaxID=1736056 RepID=UPI00344D9429
MPRSRTIQPEANVIEPSMDQEARIFIKAPPFSRTDPELWFSQLESQFFINGVTSDDLKFHTTIGIMDTESLICVRDLIIKPPMNNKFQTLRQKVLDALVESQEKKYKKLFSQLQLGDKKPSILLSEMNSLGGSSLQEEMLKTLWMQRLPHNMQTILTACSLPLSEVANIADKIADIEFSQVSQIKSEVCTSSPNEINKNTSSEEFKHITKRLDKLERQIRSHSKLRSSKFRRNSPSRDRQNSSWCWYHQNYQEKARKCVSPCDYKKEN